MKRSRTFHNSVYGFAFVLLLAEASARLLSPTLPVDPGKWPRIEIAQKLDQMRRAVNDHQDFDVVFVGSSMMAGGVDPVTFTRGSGLSSYNAAFAGPSLRTIAPWTLDIVEPLLQPDVVVVGVQSRELSDNGPKNEIMADKFLTSPGYKEASSNVAMRFAGSLERASYFLRYRRAFREPGELFAADSEAALAETAVRHEIGPRGRRNDSEGSYHAPEGFLRSLYEKTLLDFHVGGTEMDALTALQRGLQKRGVDLVVVNMPVTADYWTAHADPEADRAAYRTALKGFVSATGVTFVDAEKAFSGVDAFRDPMHLDVGGRSLLARSLADGWDELMGGGVFSIRCRRICVLTGGAS